MAICAGTSDLAHGVLILSIGRGSKHHGWLAHGGKADKLPECGPGQSYGCIRH